MSELKPCPFCGGKAEYKRKDGSYGYYASKTGVGCSSKSCPVMPAVYFVDEDYDFKKRRHFACPSKKQSAEAWNTRTKGQDSE